LVQTFAEMVRSRSVLEEAAATLSIQATYRELQRRVSAQPVGNTRLIRITAEDGNPDIAAQLANAVGDVFMSKYLEAQASRFASSRDHLRALVDSARRDVHGLAQAVQDLQQQPASPARDAELARRQGDLAQAQATYDATARSYEDVRLAEARSTNTLAVAEPAVPPDEPTRPQVLQTILMAALIGAALAAGIAMLGQHLDDRVHALDQLESATGVTLLGGIPRNSGGARPTEVLTRRLAESYRLVVSNFVAATSALRPRTLAVTSARPNEGTSTSAANLAIIMAEAGLRVILVDADLRDSSQEQLFKVSNDMGLSQLLRGSQEPAAGFVQETRVPGLRLLTAGPAPSDPSALFLSRRFDNRLGELRDLCDLVILDPPPLLTAPDAVLVAPHVDAVLLVVDMATSRMRDVIRAVEVLGQAGATIAGMLLNRVTGAIAPSGRYTRYLDQRVGAHGRIGTV
jgi:non-specific protein-tyrosine kinase